ncbi:cryptochrome [Raphidocelis subcapitata]|uniref:Cryptochrome n=1 Tax=Raphidocelis subcapitata TaxID=307507 RepID=A0A2V0P037_9CHLO|nr:cryptochrome [Raphidocelis subcapitata]|eukprot:GBF93236.1 cryptochrome [Raphidocelis subcapitata]
MAAGAPTAATAAAVASGGAADALALWWARSDLRIADNEALTAAARYRCLLPLACLDPADLQPRRSGGAGVPVMAPPRCRLLLDALAALQADLEAAGSCLAWRAEAPPSALPSALRALAPSLRAAGVSRAALLFTHAADATDRAARAEAAAAAAFEAAARELGFEPEVRGFWGATLHHPDDLPYAAFSQGAKQQKQQQQRAQRRPEALEEQQQQQDGQGGGRSCAAAGPSTAAQSGLDPRRFAALPRTMTDFRRALSAAAPPPRPPLPRPAAMPPPPPGCRGGGGGGDGGGLPAEWLAPPPREPLELYEAAGPRALAALQRLADLTACPQLARPGGAPHAACAFLFRGGEAAGAERLRRFVRGDGGGAAPALRGFAEARMLAAGVDSSAKLSPFLSLGCVSPRQVVAEVRALQAEAAAQREWQQQQQQEGGVSGSAADPAAPAPAAAAVGRTAAQPGDAAAAAVAVAAAAAPSVREQNAALGAAEQRRGKKDKRRTGGGGDGGASDEPGAWLAMHLEIRDFFIFTALKAGDALVTTGTAAFQQQGGGGGGQAQSSGGSGSGSGSGGGGGAGGAWRDDADAFARWASGRTGFPFVDASMRELAATGWMSNRSRQNAASFLAKELCLDWRLGAELFESLLLDSDPGPNWGNWSYNAGAGNDPRNRKFKTVTQGERYDAEAALAAAWLPELSALPPALRHRPWEATPEQAAAAGLVLGVTYPAPMVDPSGQIGEGPKPQPGRG